VKKRATPAIESPAFGGDGYVDVVVERVKVDVVTDGFQQSVLQLFSRDAHEAGTSLLQEKMADEHGVDARRVETAHGIAGCADQWFSKQVERRVVKHWQSGGLAGRMEEAPSDSR